MSGVRVCVSGRSAEAVSARCACIQFSKLDSHSHLPRMECGVGPACCAKMFASLPYWSHERRDDARKILIVFGGRRASQLDSSCSAIRRYRSRCLFDSIRSDQLINDIVWSNRRTHSFVTQAPYNHLIKARTASLALALPVSYSSKHNSVYVDRHGLTCHHWASVINVFASVKRSIYSYESILPSDALSISCICSVEAAATTKV